MKDCDKLYKNAKIGLIALVAMILIGTLSTRSSFLTLLGAVCAIIPLVTIPPYLKCLEKNNKAIKGKRY